MEVNIPVLGSLQYLTDSVLGIVEDILVYTCVGEKIPLDPWARR